MAERSSFGRDELDKALGLRDATKEISKFMKAIGMDTSNFSRDFTMVSREANNFATYQANAAKSTKNVNKLIEKANNLRGVANKQEAEASRLVTDRNKILLAIQKHEQKAAAAKAKNNKSEEAYYKNRAIALKAESVLLGKASEALVNQVDHSRTLAGQFENLGKTSQDLSRNVYGVAAGISETLGLSSHLTTSFEDANEIQRQRQIIQEDELELQGKINAALADYNKGKDDSVKLSEEEFLANKNNALLGEKAEKRFKDFGLEGVTEGATGATAGSNITSTKKGMKNTKSALPSELATMMKGLGKAIGALAKGMIVLKVVAKVVEMIEYAMTGVEGEAVQLARAFTLSKEEGFALRDSIRDAAKASGMLGATHMHLLKMQLAFTKSTGMSTKLNIDQLKHMSLMTRQLGFSEDAAVHLTEQFKAQGVSSEQGLSSLLKSYNTMKLQGKATTTFKDLMEDITKDTELQYIALSAGAGAAMKTAQAVRRTGLSLSQQRSMAEGTLDFEKTMTNQLELQMLTGKRINMNKAQELALQGKNGAAAAEMQKQLGQLTAEQRKNPLIMNKMLELMGMSREEYMKQKINQAEQNAAKKNELNILKVLGKETKTFTDLKATQFKNEKDYYAKLDKDTAKLAKKDLEKYQKSKQYQLDLHKDEIQGLSDVEKKEYLLNEQVRKFSDKQIHDAKVRAGLVNGELSSYEGLLTANETFAIAMEEVKVLFADLVGSGAIQFFTETLSDFAMRAKQVGIWGALRGKGKSQEEIAEQNTNIGSLGNKYIEEHKASFVRKDGTARRGDNPVKLVNKLLRNQALNEDNVLKLVELYGSKEALLEKLDSRNQFIHRQKGVSGGKFNPMEFLKDEEKFNTYSEADKAKKDAAAKALAEKNKEGDFILRPGQAPISFNKGDLIMGGTQLGQGGGKVESLLEQLLEETRAGKIIKMDTATVGRSLQLNKSKMNY